MVDCLEAVKEPEVDASRALPTGFDVLEDSSTLTTGGSDEFASPMTVSW